MSGTNRAGIGVVFITKRSIASVAVTVVQVRVMRVAVNLMLVSVGVRMRLATVPGIMSMLMMLVMHVRVSVLGSAVCRIEDRLLGRKIRVERNVDVRRPIESAATDHRTLASLKRRVALMLASICVVMFTAAIVAGVLAPLASV